MNRKGIKFINCTKIAPHVQEIAFKTEQGKSKLAARDARASYGQDLQDIKRDLENKYEEQVKQLREMVRSCYCFPYYYRNGHFFSE